MNGLIIRPDRPLSRGSLPLATKQGTDIPNEQRIERAPESLRAAVELFRSERPDAILRSITNTYNCVGFVFASRRTWIDPEHLPMILQEDEYKRVLTIEETQPGDLVIYRNDARDIVHIGVILEVRPVLERAAREIRVLSKWGGDGEYIHAPEDVHYELGQPSEYWTERKIP